MRCYGFFFRTKYARRLHFVMFNPENRIKNEFFFCHEKAGDFFYF